MFITEATSQVPITGAPASHPMPMFWGYVGIAVAAVFFGSNLIPVKKFQTGDGAFFQWVFCIAIWTTGFVLNGIRLFPQFLPLSMLGGFLWCTGNVMVVPILKTVGLSQGMLIWASVAMLTGWAVGRFGLLGLKSDIPPNVELNYVGVVLCLISTVIYMFLKTSNPSPSSGDTGDQLTSNPSSSNVQTNDPLTSKASPSSGETSDPLLSNEAPVTSPSDNTPAAVEDNAVTRTSVPVGDPPVFYERMSPAPRRLLGILMAVTAGIMFGVNFCPVIYMQQNPEQFPTASSNGMDYVFAHFTGILITSTVYMLIYSAAMKNKPRIYPQVILPGFVAGVTWGMADMGWFVANDTLSQPVSFPIITSLPALIGAFWGIVLFGEIKGRRNFVILLLAVCFALAGSILTGLSKLDNSAASQNTTTTSVTTTSSNSNAVTNLVTSI